MSLDGAMEKQGFYTARFVTAENLQQAQKTAFEALEDRLERSIQNNPSDPYRFVLVKSEELNPRVEVKSQPGILLYKEWDEAQQKKCLETLERIFNGNSA